MPKTQSKA